MKLPDVNIESRGSFVPVGACYLEIRRSWEVGLAEEAYDYCIPTIQDLRNKIIGKKGSEKDIVRIRILSGDVNLEEWMGTEAYIGNYTENIKDEHTVRLIETFTRPDGEYLLMSLESESCMSILARFVGKGKWVLVRNESEGDRI